LEKLTLADFNIWKLNYNILDFFLRKYLRRNLSDGINHTQNRKFISGLKIKRPYNYQMAWITDLSKIPQNLDHSWNTLSYYYKIMATMKEIQRYPEFYILVIMN